MNPQELFHDDFRDALRHAVKALGGYDTVGSDLWPAKTRKAAGAWLSDCLNPERPAKLDLEEIVRIVAQARAEGVHFAMHQFCDETGYTRPEIAPKRTQSQQLADELERLTSQVRRVADEHAAALKAEDSNVRLLDRRS